MHSSISSSSSSTTLTLVAIDIFVFLSHVFEYSSLPQNSSPSQLLPLSAMNPSSLHTTPSNLASSSITSKVCLDHMHPSSPHYHSQLCPLCSSSTSPSTRPSWSCQDQPVKKQISSSWGPIRTPWPCSRWRKMFKRRCEETQNNRSRHPWTPP